MKKLPAIIVIIWLTGSFTSAQQTEGPDRAEPRFFANLVRADSAEFALDYEMPFMFVLNDDERKDYNTIEDIEGRKNYIARYIRSKDKNPLYDYNLWFLEYMDRVRFARKEFPSKEPPYFDDRGKVIIKYGKPFRKFTSNGGLKRVELFYDDMMDHAAMSQAVSNRVSSAMDGNVTQQAGASLRSEPLLKRLYSIGQEPDIEFFVKPNETWHYVFGFEEFSVHFVKEGRFRRVESLKDALLSTREHEVIWQWSELIKERDHLSMKLGNLSESIRLFEDRLRDITEVVISENGGSKPHLTLLIEKSSFEHQEKTTEFIVGPNADNRFTKVNTLNFAYDIAQFRNEDGKTRLEILFRVPIQPSLDQRTKWYLPDSLELTFESMLRNSDFENVSAAGSSFLYPVDRNLELGYDNAVGRVIMRADPQVAELTLNVEESIGEQTGFLQDEISLRDFSGRNLMISDILFYAEGTDPDADKTLPVEEIGSIKIIPYPSEEISRSRPMLCYFEIYNIQDSGIRGTYDIDIEISMSDSMRSTLGKVASYLSRSRRFSTSVKQSRMPDSNDSRELLSLDISTLRDGAFVFSVTVSDQNDKSISARSQKIIRIRQ